MTTRWLLFFPLNREIGFFRFKILDMADGLFLLRLILQGVHGCLRARVDLSGASLQSADELCGDGVVKRIGDVTIGHGPARRARPRRPNFVKEILSHAQQGD